MQRHRNYDIMFARREMKKMTYENIVFGLRDLQRTEDLAIVVTANAQETADLATELHLSGTTWVNIDNVFYVNGYAIAKLTFENKIPARARVTYVSFTK